MLNIVGELVALGPACRDLISTYQRWINDFGTARTLALAPHPITREQEEKWYEDGAKSEEHLFFTIYERENLQPIGGTDLHAIDYRNRTADFGILIGEPEYRGKGYGTETTRLMLDHAFSSANPHNVMLTVFEFNAAGIRAYEKAGFREYGRRRQSYFADGRYWNIICMDCLSTEFESPVFGYTPAPDEKHRAWTAKR